MDKATCKTKKRVEFRKIKSRDTCHFGKFPKFHFSQFSLAKQKRVHIKMSYIQNVFTFISTLAAFGKLIFQGFHTDKSHLKGCLQIINTYILVHTYRFPPLMLHLPPAPPSASCRLQTGCRAGETVCLDVNFLLKDSCENELSSDDWERRRDGGAAQRPVLLTGNHHSLRLGNKRGRLQFRFQIKVE